MKKMGKEKLISDIEDYYILFYQLTIISCFVYKEIIKTKSNNYKVIKALI